MANQSVPNDAIRIGDREREQMSERLAKAHSLGQLTLDEFDERVTKVHAARTRGELSEVAADLPSERGDGRGRHSGRGGYGPRGPRGHRPDFAAMAGDRRQPPRIVRIALVAFAIWLVLHLVFGALSFAAHVIGFFLPMIALVLVGAFAFHAVRRMSGAR